MGSLFCNGLRNQESVVQLISRNPFGVVFMKK